MNNLYDTLEICLNELDHGVELETILARYPDMAAELRPMLRAALTAQQEAVPTPAQHVVMRNQAKVLQRFDQVWDAKPATRSWFPVLSRRVVGFALLLIVFFFSGTNLVRASFSSLPGDGLYPVKLSWEKATLLFTFDAHVRQNLQLKYDDERLKEISQLFGTGRTAHVEFVGAVTIQHGDEWRVATISVIVSTQTKLPSQAIQNGNLVRVIGTTKGDGIVLAERIELVAVSTPAPTMIPTQPELETEQPIATSQPENENTNLESETETPVVQGTDTATPTQAPKIESFEGTLISIDQSVWKIDAIIVEAGQAEIKGIPVIGATVKAEGYFGADSIFVATKLEIINNNSSNDNSLNSNSDNGNININGNTNTGGNSNDGNDSGGGSNDNGGGGSGGGGG